MNLSFYLKKKYQKFMFNLSANENFLYLGFYKYLYIPPKNSISSFLDIYSKNKSPIKFLQIGANDGFIHDPLQKFIKRDNWTGVMLEPQPDVYREFLSRLHVHRNGIETINAALDKKDGKTILYTINASQERWATGLASFDKNVLLQNLKLEKTKRKAKKEGLQIPSDQEQWIKAVEINTISPKSLWSRFNGNTLDLLAIDTEGFDFEIIKILDIQKLNPQVIIYEEANFDDDTKIECKNFLKALGYETKSIDKDGLAIKNASTKN